MRVFGVVQPVWHHIQKTWCVALNAPLVSRILAAKSPLALNVVLMLLPVAFAQLALLLPGALIPHKQQVIGKLLSQPHVRAVTAVHTHAVLHVLIGNRVDTELVHKLLQLLGRASLLNSPDGLCQGVGTAPCSHVDWSCVVLVGQSYQQLAARRIVIGSDGLYSAMDTAHHRTTLHVVGTRPVAYILLFVLILKRHEFLLSRASHQLWHILSVSLYHSLQILRPFSRVGVAVPSHRCYQRLNLKHIGIRHQPHHRLHIVGLNIRRRNIRTHHKSRFQVVLSSLERICPHHRHQYKNKFPYHHDCLISQAKIRNNL